MKYISDRYLVPFIKFSLFMFQLLTVLAIILFGIGCYWWFTGNGYEPAIWGMKTLVPGIGKIKRHFS
jgi:hypothetical protein